jgi:AcrR family transcriptional regulator
LNDQSSKKIDTKEVVVEAARQLFFEQGYTATGIAQILKRSGVKSGSLYYFFPTKEDLLAAVLDKYKDMLWPMVLEPAYARAVDPIERIFAVLNGYRQLLMATDFRLGCPIGNLALEMSNSHPHVRDLVVQNFDGWRAAISQLLAEASDRLPEDIDPESMSFFVLATMEGAVMLARAHQDIAPFDATITSLRDQFDRLLQDGSTWSSPKGASKENS